MFIFSQMHTYVFTFFPSFVPPICRDPRYPDPRELVICYTSISSHVLETFEEGTVLHLGSDAEYSG